ncbi:hypothetical protein [Aquamicrobium defluvii]|uniref:hypothetical protein n=1 Tax=Aquamicrobium defluvii TaxID=69279 RepID=UPI000B2BAB96|nr:hypothetical protein [Aquamicrobium defluvii]
MDARRWSNLLKLLAMAGRSLSMQGNGNLSDVPLLSARLIAAPGIFRQKVEKAHVFPLT